jgi:hypothetical protein
MVHAITGHAVLPLPALPLPSNPSGVSPRCAQRSSHARHLFSLANNCISALNSLNSSFSRRRLFSSSLVPSLSVMQTSALSSMVPLYSEVDSSIDLSTSDYSFSPAHQASLAPTSAQSRIQQSILQSCKLAFGRPSSPVVCDSFSPLSTGISSSAPADSFSYISNAITATPLIASQVSLPKTVGTASMIDLLPSDLAARYATPSAIVQTSAPSITSRAFVHGPRTEYIKLLERLHTLGVIRFIETPAAVNSIFTVPKGDGQQRLILDARPCNEMHVVPPTVNLPTPDCLASLRSVGPDPLFVAGSDVDNFYWRLRLPDWLVPYFAMPPVSVGEVPFWSTSLPSSARVFPALLVLPMGWSHSVFVAQQVHLNVIYTRTSLRPDDAILRGSDSLIDRPRHSVYIDDVAFFGSNPGQLRILQDEYIAAMESVNLHIKPSKLTRPSSGVTQVLGLSVHGSERFIALDGTKLQLLRARTAAFLRRKSCTGLELSSLIGAWTWAMLVRRPCLSVFANVYRFVAIFGPSPATIWRSVRSELATAMALAPLMRASFDLPNFGHVLATDASSSGCGVVRRALTAQDTAVLEALKPLADFTTPSASRTPPPAASTGHPTSCSPGTTTPQPELVSAQRASQLLPLFQRHSRWTGVASFRWKVHEHINSLEARAVSTALRFCASCPSGLYARIFLLSDSTAVIGALAKGRTSAPLFQRRIRSLSALILATHSVVYPVWVPTHLNPADGPSRL